jgi:uncharacterized protein YkwD
VYGPVDSPDDRATRPAGPARRHHERHRVPAAAALGLSVTGLVAVFGLGTALLPASLTGPGTPAELPAAAVAALAPGAGGGAPGGKAVTPAASPSPTVPPSAIPSPTRTAATPARPTPPAKKKPTIQPGLAGQETEVIRLVNVERGKAGCGAVKLNVKLQTAIRLHVAELGTHGNLYISHVSDDGRTFVDRAKAQGYDDPGGENVARGQRDAADVMNSWMNSAGHRANILNCSFTAIGAGAVKGVDGTIVWGQLFGRS